MITKKVVLVQLVITLAVFVSALVAQPVDPVPVAVQNVGGNSLIWLAVINVCSLAVLAIIARWADHRKDTATAKAISDAAVLEAKIKADEKKQDWDRQDAVAKAVADTAQRAVDAAAETARRQDEVAARVQTAATQAADAAKLLLEQQDDARNRQDQVADRVQKAADQAAEAAQLLAAAQDRMTVATEEVARLAAESDTRVREQLRAIDEQGRKIHILVNSDMTAARTAERDSLQLLVISLRNALALSKKLGLEVDSNEHHEITKVEKRIVELDQILEDRQKAQQIVDAEARGSQTALQHDQASRPLPTIMTDRRRLDDSVDPSHPIRTATTTKALHEIVKNTAETAENTARTAEKTDRAAAKAEKAVVKAEKAVEDIKRKDMP